MIRCAATFTPRFSHGAHGRERPSLSPQPKTLPSEFSERSRKRPPQRGAGPCARRRGDGFVSFLLISRPRNPHPCYVGCEVKSPFARAGHGATCRGSRISGLLARIAPLALRYCLMSKPEAKRLRSPCGFLERYFFGRSVGESPQKSPQWGKRKEIAERVKSPRMNGEPGRTRTYNPLIKSQLLYH